MSIVSISADNPVFGFWPDNRPRAHAKPGDSIALHTADTYYATLSGHDIDHGLADFKQANALCGPVFVEGAHPGDAVGLRIDSIITGDRAFIVYVERWRHAMFGLPESQVIEVKVHDGYALLQNGGRIAARPMIGCIGVAPAVGSVSSLSPAARTGGNMDLVELSIGATIWLPVEVEGALLSLGDLHVRMGRGEPVGSGLECAGEVIVTIEVAAARKMSGPIVCDSARISFVGTGDDKSGAESIAVRAAWDWLTNDCGIDRDDGLTICAALLDVNHGGPAGSNVVAGFSIDGLRDANVVTNVWPLKTMVRSIEPRH